MTSTAKITLQWFERNKLGEPLDVVHHSIGWTHDIPEPSANAPTHPRIAGKGIPVKDYPHFMLLDPAPNKSKLPPNMLSSAVVIFALEIIAGLIWLVLR